MKLSRLFVLGALWLTGLSVSAADLIERTAPEQPDWTVDVASINLNSPSEFEVGKVYALYNVDSEMFFYHGNAWGSQATGSADQAIPVRFVLPAGKSLSDKQLYLRDFDDRSGENKWRTAFVTTGDGKVNGVYGEGTPALFIDNNDGGAALLWVESAGSLTYRLSISESNTTTQPEGAFIGIDPEGPGVESGEPGTAIMPKITTGNLDWQFFALDEMTQYFVDYDVFVKSEELKKLINDAEAAGTDVTAAVAVYNNPNATIEQMDAAMEALSKAMADNTFAGFTPGTALDVTKLIVNSNFTGGDVSGWDGDGWGHGNSQDNVEHYNHNYNTYQTIAGLPAGLYVVGMNGFYRAGTSQESYDKGKADNDDVRNAKFYAMAGDETIAEQPVEQIYSGIQTVSQVGGDVEVTDGDTGVKYSQPNTAASADYYIHTLGLYKNSLFATMPSAGGMTIGVKKDIAIGSDWSIFDDFTLIYCGEGTQAYQAYAEYYRDNAFPNYAELRVDAADPFITTDGINCSDSYIDAFKSTSVSATDEASARAAMAALEEAFEPLRENVALWTEYLTLAKKAANEVANNSSLNHQHPIVEEVDDWTILAAEAWDAREMSNEDLRAFIDDMAEKIKEAKKQFDVSPTEQYATDLLVNPDFENGTTGWTIEKAAGGNVAHGGNNDNHCFEGWNNSKYDIYQVVKDAPEGVYRIEVQGFYRYGRNEYTAYHNQENEYVKPGGSPVYVYMNHKQTPFTNVYGDEMQITEASFYNGTAYQDVPVDEQGNQVEADQAVQHLYFPNDMASAAKAFSAQMYKQSAYGIIRAGQDMRIGVKGNSSQLGDSWCIWDNFQLFNCGKDVTALNNVLPEEIQNASNMLVNEDGSAKVMGKSIRAALEKAIADAQAALGTTGDKMFDALNDLFDAEENVDASVELFAKLASANDRLMKALENYSDSPFSDEAWGLYEEIADGLGDNQYENEDVEGLLKRVNTMMTKLRLPADYESATKDSPVDFTVVVNSPEYQTSENDPTAEGWEGTEVGTNGDALNAELFSKTPFDHYQEIAGLPEGAYRVSVQAFYRFGGDGPKPDYTAYNEDPSANNNASLYTTTDAGTWTKVLPRLSEFVSTDHANEDGWAEVEDGSGLWVPNSMVAAGTFFDEHIEDEDVKNTVLAKLGKDGVLRLGLKKDEGTDKDWCIFDNWTLEYLGTDTSIVPAAGQKPGDVNADGAVDVADISNIITIMAEGATNMKGDVNGDGVVDVADISSVITIMAASARAKGKFVEE